MTVATDIRYGIGETVGIHVNELNFGLNARYGWGENNNILEAYKAKNEALKEKIEQWGFRKVHAVEAYYNDEGQLIIKHGNRRTFAAKWIYADDPDSVIAWDLPAGEIWVTIVEKPSSVIELLSEQVADNEQLAATKLDTLMVYQARVDEILKAGDAKTPNNAIKLIAKQDFKTKAERLIGTDSINTIEDAYKSLKKELTAYETNLKKDLRVMTLSPQVLSWLQESYLDACDVKLSFGKINELLTEYGEKADLLLKEALQEVTLESRDEYSQNGFLSSKWLENLAKKLGLVEEEKPKKPAKPAPVATSTDDSNDDEKEELTLETQEEEETEQEETSEKSPRLTTGNIQSKAKKSKDFYFMQVQKALSSDLGLCIVDANNVLIQEPSPGIFSVTIDLPTKDLAQQFEVFLTNLKAAFGDAEAVAELDPSTPSRQEHNPLDDVDLGDIEY